MEVPMRKPLRPAAVAVICALCAVLLLAETVVVKIQSTVLRKEPKFYAQTLVNLKAGEKLEKLASQEGWLQVRTASGAVGWVHGSAVESKSFGLLAMDKSMKTQASASEVALAGKGFNKQVEESYRAKHGNVSFVWVDKMVQIKVPAAELEKFLKSGKLGEFGGGK
jgi:SH3-like domain-containing protein